ncbi:hypothetical protein F0L74_07880 [Chitinophaga agrisoli]|uniref:Prolyl oligopeptidase family protein n=1 Tax=Chitinophaga agrisoli TaxID=2607653 RepID=A0A5B2VUM0_9BACT|nr:hypothetical protein [Chitinophaga agrisoli]KAA2242454.1 hypothetical protein F0L74_07880 [Chitinophaga agrisoli]
MFLKNLILLGSMWVWGSADGQYAPMQPIQVKISPWQTRPALILTPEKAVPGKKYPLLICFHGRSIAGHDLGKIFREGVTRQIHEGRRIEAVNPKDKQLYEFIVLAPLAESWSFTPQDIEPMLDDVIKRYPVDVNRIYLTGYSAGGWAVESAKTHNAHLASRIAACVTMSPPILDSPYLKRYKVPADAGIHTWYFAGSDDGYFLGNVRTYIDSTNKYKQGLTRLTVYKGGHCCWHDLYNPLYRENGMNVYEWLLQYKNTD